MNAAEAKNNVVKLLSEVDQKNEIIPFNNLNKFIQLLEFLKGSVLQKEEELFARKLIQME